MKKIIWFLLSLCILSCNGDLDKELQDLRRELDIQKQLIENIKNNVNITSVNSVNHGYIINFSDNTSINILNGETPTITIGNNGNWIINNSDTEINAEGKDGINGNSPKIEINDNGNWVIDGVDTLIKATGKDGLNGQNSPIIQSIIQTENDFVFNFSDGKEIIVPVFSKFKQIACWGDSLTANNVYPKELQKMLGESYQVINCGVGGENSRTIAARQGGMPIYIKKSFIIPGNNIEEVVLGNKADLPFFSLHDDISVQPLLLGGESTINNCVIDNNICTIKWTGNSWNDFDGNWILKRADNGVSYMIPEKSIVFTSSMRKYRNLFANVFFNGQNGGFSDANDLVDQYRKMIEFSGSPNYIIVGFHKYNSVETMKGIEKVMIKEFGASYINLREYMVVNGLRDANLVPTEEDLEAINSGICPPQLLTDGVHFTTIAYNLIANLIYERMLNLGMVI